KLFPSTRRSVPQRQRQRQRIAPRLSRSGWIARTVQRPNRRRVRSMNLPMMYSRRLRLFSGLAKERRRPRERRRSNRNQSSSFLVEVEKRKSLACLARAAAAIDAFVAVVAPCDRFAAGNTEQCDMLGCLVLVTHG